MGRRLQTPPTPKTHPQMDQGTPMTTFRDNGGKLPAGLTKITNTTGHDILVSPYPRFGTSNYFTVRISIEEYDRHQRMQATILHHRYWHDFAGQPRRNPTMRPLLHNGKAPR